MLDKIFINEALSEAISNYLKYKEKPEDENFSSFPVMVIRTLIYIYGELDIINPYITLNEHNMGGFDNNLTKYGFPTHLLQDFKDCFLKYKQEVAEAKPLTSLIQLEKYLIDMYFCKQKMMHIPESNQEEFRRFLYFGNIENPIMQNTIEKYNINKQELEYYFQSKNYEANHNFSLEELRRSTLIPEAYILLGYSLEQISGLSDIDIRNVNQQVYQFFKVDPNLDDHQELLQKAVNYYKKYGNKVTSGNGYVDFLLFASVLATALLITTIVLFR